MGDNPRPEGASGRATARSCEALFGDTARLLESGCRSRRVPAPRQRTSDHPLPRVPAPSMTFPPGPEILARPRRCDALSRLAGNDQTLPRQQGGIDAAQTICHHHAVVSEARQIQPGSGWRRTNALCDFLRLPGHGPQPPPPTVRSGVVNGGNKRN
jgi:hypothetical protein